MMMGSRGWSVLLFWFRYAFCLCGSLPPVFCVLFPAVSTFPHYLVVFIYPQLDSAVVNIGSHVGFKSLRWIDLRLFEIFVLYLDSPPLIRGAWCVSMCRRHMAKHLIPLICSPCVVAEYPFPFFAPDPYSAFSLKYPISVLGMPKPYGVRLSISPGSPLLFELAGNRSGIFGFSLSWCDSNMSPQLGEVRIFEFVPVRYSNPLYITHCSYGVGLTIL